MNELDEFDLSILRLLQTQARLKTEAIAQEVGLSATAVQRRIKRLRDNQTIYADLALVDPKAVGGRIIAIVGVVLEQGNPNTMDMFKQATRCEPEVQQCYWVTGEFDFFLVVAVKDMSAYEALTRRLFIDNPGVRRFDTFVAMDAVKCGLEIPL